MQVFVKSIQEGSQIYTVEPNESILSLKEKIQEQEGISASLMRLIYAGHSLEDAETMAEMEIEENATLHLALDLQGGKKKRKKKVYTTKKKTKHKHQNTKLAVLKFYSIDGNGTISRARHQCANCGVGVFMARHYDRFYCGKCRLTLKLDPSKWLKKPEKKKKEDAPKEDKKDSKKDAKKGKKKK